MSVILTAIVAVITAGVAAVCLAGLVKVRNNLTHRIPVPRTIWVSLLQIAVFCAGGVFLLTTHGRGSRFLSLCIMAGPTVGIVRMWIEKRERRKEANYSAAGTPEEEGARKVEPR